MIEIDESSSILTTAHAVRLRPTGSLIGSLSGGWETASPRAPWARSFVVFGSEWGEAFELRSLWELGPLQALMRLRALPQNWDGAGSPPPTTTAVARSVHLLRLIADMGYDALPVPHTVPLAKGGIQFEWMSGNRELEIEIVGTGAVEFVTADAGDPQREGRLTSLDQLRQLFAWLVAV